MIDDAEVKNGVREDGTIYSVYSFARKLGQAFSSGMVGGLLSLIGYSQATAFDPVVTEGIFKISCIVPIIGLTAVALALIFLYPLNKKRVEENSKELARRREKIEKCTRDCLKTDRRNRESSDSSESLLCYVITNRNVRKI